MPVVKCSQCRATTDPGSTGRCGECGKRVSLPWWSDSTSEHRALGGLRKTYHAGSGSHWINIIVGLSLALCLIGVPLLLEVVAPPRDILEWLALGLLYLMMAGGYAFLIYGVLLPAVADLKLRIHLYEGGLVIERGNEVGACQWNEVESIWLKRNEAVSVLVAHAGPHAIVPVAVIACFSSLDPWTELILRTRDGRTVRLTYRIKDNRELADAVEAEITAWQLPEVQGLVARGEEVSFDGISVSDEGLHQPGDRFLPWHKVEEVRLEKTSIVVWKRKRRLNWCLIPRYKVANLKVFLAIVDQYTKESLERAPG